MFAFKTNNKWWNWIEIEMIANGFCSHQGGVHTCMWSCFFQRWEYTIVNIPRCFKVWFFYKFIYIFFHTGAGDYYCSGNDLNNFMNVDPSNMQEMSKQGGVILE